MHDLRFFEYNYDTREIVEYRRDGECNHCGDCCTTRIDFYGIGHKEQGVWGCVVEEGKPDFFQQVAQVGETGAEVCAELVNERCRIHAIKRRMCALWPMTPVQAALFPHCSYSFSEIKREGMKDNER